VLRQGKPLLVFPEGTRTKDGQVSPFKMGLFYAAVRAGAPVVPVAVHGTGVLMAAGAVDIASARGGRRAVHRVYVRIGEPLAPRRGGSEARRAADLRDRTHAAVVALHQALELAERQGACPSGEPAGGLSDAARPCAAPDSRPGDPALLAEDEIRGE